jgi:glycosyltransferase involved in cell wall biosynthesis
VLKKHERQDPRIVFTEQFYYPDGWAGAQLPRDVTTHLARSGFQVEVICGSDPYAPVEGSAGEDPRVHGVRLIRLPRIVRGDIHSHKLLRQIWFYLCVAPLLALRRRPSLYVTQTNPPLLVPIVALCAWLRWRPFIIVAQDIYPEVLIAHGMARSEGAPARLLGAVFRWAYRRARRVVSLGTTMTRRLVDKGVPADRVVEISNWATGDESIVKGAANVLRAQWDLTGKFVVLYSGNVGVAHDVETPILGLKAALPRMPRLHLVIVGKGTRLEEAKALVQEHGLGANVTFRALVPTELLPHSLGLADVALVTLKSGFEGLVVPSKALGYMARGVPTLFVGPPSDIQSIIDAASAGACVRGGDIDGFAKTLVALASDASALARMGAAGETYYRTHLSKDIGLAKYRRLVSDELAR